MKTAGFALALALAIPSAFGARPLTTEDASILDGKHCQLEAWIDRAQDATQGWLVPACNLGANIEWQAGFARTRASGESRFSEWYAQGKTAMQLGETPWSIGAVAGILKRPGVDSSENPYGLVAVSGDFTSAMLHGNVGWSRDRGERRDVTTWAIALEAPVHERAVLLAEAFGENRERPYWRAGARWTAVPKVLDLDLSVVARSGGGRADRIISAGFLYQAGRLMP